MRYLDGADRGTRFGYQPTAYKSAASGLLGLIEPPAGMAAALCASEADWLVHPVLNETAASMYTHAAHRAMGQATAWRAMVAVLRGTK